MWVETGRIQLLSDGSGPRFVWREVTAGHRRAPAGRKDVDCRSLEFTEWYGVLCPEAPLVRGIHIEGCFGLNNNGWMDVYIQYIFAYIYNVYNSK